MASSSKPNGQPDNESPSYSDVLSLWSVLGVGQRLLIKVPERFRKGNEEFYRPRLVSIGPFHDIYTILRCAGIKLQYRDAFAARYGLNNGHFRDVGSSLGEAARVYYSGSLEQIPKDFGTMMMVDGVFLLELMLRHHFPEYRKAGDDDPIFNSTSIIVDVCRDILLIENQLPLIVLEELYQQFVGPHSDTKDVSLAQLASDFFNAHLFGSDNNIGNGIPPTPKGHFVAFVRSFYSPRLKSIPSPSSRSSSVKLILPSVTTLYEAKVKFKKVTSTSNRLNIEFDRGNLKIPYLNFQTGTIFLNMMVLEEYENFLVPDRNFVSQFMFFMGWMIRTSKDVDILIESGIIDSMLASNTDLVALFDRIRKMGWPHDYSDLCQILNYYCLINERPSYPDGSLFWASLGVAHRMIGKVSGRFRKGNEEFYGPRVVSIGPYYDIDTNLRCVDLKLQYVDDFVTHCACQNVNLRDVASRLGERARVYYSGYLEQSPEYFGLMMLVDGVFLLELMLRSRFPEYRNRRGGDDDEAGDDDPIFISRGIIVDVCRDILLIENQLPWFVLEDLYQEFVVPHPRPDEKDVSLAQLASDFFNAHLFGSDNNIIGNGIPPTPTGYDETQFDEHSKAHLVAFVRSLYSPRRKSTPSSSSSTAHGDGYRRTSDNDNDVNITVELNQRSKAPLVAFFRSFYCPRWKSTPSSSSAAADGDNYRRTSNNESIPPRMTRLCEAGVKFEKVSSTSNGLNIEFHDGRLVIPYLDDRTGTLFLNMMAFEEYENFSVLSGGNYVSQFMFFMGWMIRTSRDVDILIDSGIISSMLGSNTDLVALFDRIRKMGSPHDYFDLCNQLSDYCENNPWHRWKATLKRDYFNTPWKTASTIAAVILLLLTFTQTVCSVLSLKH